MYSPDEIAERQFLISLRGYDRDEVSAFLDEVAAQVRTLQQRIAELESERDAAAEAALEARAQEDTPTDRRASFRELGEETTRILETAEEAAEQMRNRADEESRSLLEEARREAADARESAQQEANSILEEARSKAEHERERASDTATQVLEEARSSARETLDTANARHREIAETVRELDELRERLVDDLRTVSETIGGAVDRLAGDPDEITLPEVPEGTTVDELTEEVEVAGPGPAVAEGAAQDEDAAQDGDSEQVEHVEHAEEVEPASGSGEAEAAPDEAGGDRGPSPAVADVASRELRDQALAGIRPGMLRRLKRTLQDVQNGVLDAIRREPPDAGVTNLLPTDDELAPLHSVGEAFLGEAYRAGLGDGSTLAAVPPSGEAEDPERVAAATDEFRNSVGHEVVAALEPSLAAGLEAGEDESSLGERVSEAFRGLKGPVAESAADQSLMRIHALGTHDAWVAAGVDARVWVVGEETRCPENRCRANADEGAVPFDHPFPSGDTVPPAHAGCTCTLAPS